MSGNAFAIREGLQSAAFAGTAALARVLHAFVSATTCLFLITLGIMLFRPPDLQLYSVDRIAFGLLIFIVALQVIAQHTPVPFSHSLSWPMLGLLLISVCSVITRPFDVRTWSLLAAEFVVPFTLFHLAIVVFRSSASVRKFEMFSLIVLGYLIFTSIAFLAGANSLIYPRFILDESLGIHADRARGPFLQAVANGVTLNILGLVVLDAHARRRFGPVATYFVIATLPTAILATMTRSVWIAFFASAAWLFIRGSTRTQRVCASIFCLAVIAAIGIAIGSTTLGSSVDNRAQERSSVDLRFAAYEAGWEMFLERPWLGRGFNQMPAEIARRISHRDIDTLSVHNTYLQIFAECGIVGFALFLWLISGMFRLTRGHPRALRNSGDSSFQPFRSVWAVLLSIYLVNAVFVVMNYQFVNGLLFTLAGIIEARNQSCPRSGAQS